MLRELQQHYLPFPNGIVIPNGRDPSQFYSSTKEPIVFACGRIWDEAKNITALEAIASGIDWRVYVAGDNEHPSGRFARLNRLGVPGNPSQAELAAWYASGSTA